MDDDLELREKAFHGAVREYVICMLIFLALYIISYAILRALKKRNAFDDLYGGDAEDYVVYRISLWICTLSMAVSVAAVLLIPFSICSNEILLRYPRNYYIQWLNDSLVHSLWNYVFLLSNLCLFFLLPFAYFFIESQGFVGFRNGLMTRVYESAALCCLVILLGFCFARLLYILLHDEQTRNQSLFNIWYYQLPFIYSCVSLFGAALLLTCTPLGFATLFSVFGELVAKPKFRSDIQHEYALLILEEESLKRKIRAYNNYQQADGTFSSFERPSNNHARQRNGFYSNSDEFWSSSFDKVEQRNEFIAPSFMQNNNNQFFNFSTENDVGTLTERLMLLERRKMELKKLSKSWLWLQNLKYPLLMLVLLFLTGIAVFMVVLNALELLVGFKSLPRDTEKFELGTISLSKLGIYGTVVEAIMTLYLMATSLVGFYSLPVLKRLRPNFRQTSMTKIICNCVVLIILTSALPVLARTLGLTTFDLLGDYGKLDWLGNFYLVLSYNFIFAVAAGLCLVTKFTSKIRHELMSRFNEAGVHLRETNYWLMKTSGRKKEDLNFSFIDSTITKRQRSISADASLFLSMLNFKESGHGKSE